MLSSSLILTLAPLFAVVSGSSGYVRFPLTLDANLYYIQGLSIGTPAQSIDLIALDTGSADLVLDNRFDKSSSSFVDSGDKVIAGYGSIDWFNESIVTDTLRYAEGSMSALEWGLYNSTLPYGIFGVGYDTLTAFEANYGNFPSRLVSDGTISRNMYSIFGGTSGTPTIIFGGIDQAKFTGPLQKTPILYEISSKTTRSFYVTSGITVNSIKVGDSTVQSEKAPYVIDTGSNVWATTPQVYDNVLAALGYTPYSSAMFTNDSDDDFPLYPIEQLEQTIVEVNVTGISLSFSLIDISSEEYEIDDIAYGTLNLFGFPFTDDYGYVGTLPNAVLKSTYMVWDLEENIMLFGALLDDGAAEDIVAVSGKYYPVATIEAEYIDDTYTTYYNSELETTLACQTPSQSSSVQCHFSSSNTFASSSASATPSLTSSSQIPSSSSAPRPSSISSIISTTSVPSLYATSSSDSQTFTSSSLSQTTSNTSTSSALASTSASASSRVSSAVSQFSSKYLNSTSESSVIASTSSTAVGTKIQSETSALVSLTYTVSYSLSSSSTTSQSSKSVISSSIRLTSSVSLSRASSALTSPSNSYLIITSTSNDGHGSNTCNSATSSSSIATSLSQMSSSNPSLTSFPSSTSLVTSSELNTVIMVSSNSKSSSEKSSSTTISCSFLTTKTSVLSKNEVSTSSSPPAPHSSSGTIAISSNSACTSVMELSVITSPSSEKSLTTQSSPKKPLISTSLSDRPSSVPLPEKSYTPTTLTTSYSATITLVSLTTITVVVIGSPEYCATHKA